MSVFSTQGRQLWSFERESPRPEPFNELLFKECSLDKLEQKIEFLENDVLLLRSMCEALEFHIVKEYPEFLDTKVIDVSWMPYDLLNTGKIKTATRLPDVVKGLRRKSVLSNLNKSKSLFSLTKRTIAVRKIGINYMIFLLEKIIMHMEIDFDKQYNAIIKNREQIANKTENSQADSHKIHQRIEEYRLKVLEAGYDPLTKRIPASKYEMFVKQQFMMNAAIINGFYVKIDNLTIERKLLEKELYQVAKQANGLCEVDHKQLEMKHYKIYLELKEKCETEKKMKARGTRAQQYYIFKKYKMEENIKELKTSITSIEAKIKKINKKIKPKDNTEMTIDCNSYISDDCIDSIPERI